MLRPFAWFVLLLLVLAGSAPSGLAQKKSKLPIYQGPAALVDAAFPSVQAEVERAYASLNAAFSAVQQQDTKGAKNHLSAAASTLGAALEANPGSREAAVALGVVYFYQGYYGDRKGLERCIAFLEQMLAVDPDAEQAARYLAHAYSHQGDTKQVIYYAGYTESLTSDPELLREMAEVRKPFQEAFLTTWYDYADYYESKAAKVTEFNPQTYKFDTILQVTPQLENELAANGLQALTPSLAISQDQALTTYLQSLVDKIVSQTPGPSFTYAVKAVDSPEVNALAFPGEILVFTGLLKFVENEAELVAVLSHELAHIYAHHGARQMVADFQNRRLASTALALVKVQGEIYQQALTIGTEAALTLIQRGYSRQQEKEADRYGTHLAYNAGYNPTFMTTFFLRLFGLAPKSPFRLLSTHPPTSDRIEYTTRYLESFPLDTEMQLDSQEFKDMKQRLP